MSSRIKTVDLPEDLIVLLEQMIGNESPPYLPLDFELREFNPMTVPHIDLSLSFGDCRGEEYALEMKILNMPPLIIAHGFLVDGQHRLWKLQRENITNFHFIDISKLTNKSIKRFIIQMW